MKTFRKRIKKMITVPVERIAFRKDKWGDLATVYFHGKARPESIADDMMDNDTIATFMWGVKNGSSRMVEEAEKTYGENWRKYIKHRG